MTLIYVQHQKISLKRHPEFNEKWLQDDLAEADQIVAEVT